ncbi:terpenoid synthase [Aspergillus piperis CBS 112811]|uniref:Terpenoid synthase n=1 Tax=Aspergillus piperis CBS 112811 TaxID=1448313 RepID=A0A8G1QR46_9EURO|nr:terpenoid synthase [Aspergillus piperis CBS 112811]RAH52113.1 terpenoid synthase [Aspergillus piperis CBS 112811]
MTTVTPDDFFKIISPFLEEVFLDLPPYHKDEAFHQEVLDQFTLSGLPEDVVRASSEAGAVVAECFYPSLKDPLRLSIAVWTAYIFSLDNICTDASFRDQMKSYRSVFFGQSTDLKFLNGLYTSLEDLSKYYDTFAGDMIMKSVLDYVSINILEEEQKERKDDFMLSSSTSMFPDFLRQKSAIGEAYAFLNFPGSWNVASYFPLIPDMAAIVDRLNDVVSFYKESVLGNEAGTLVRQTCVCLGVSEYEAIEIRAAQCLDCIQRLRGACQGDVKLLKRVNEFIQGYALYHLCLDRYKLNDFGNYEAWFGGEK